MFLVLSGVNTATSGKVYIACCSLGLPRWLPDCYLAQTATPRRLGHGSKPRADRDGILTAIL